MAKLLGKSGGWSELLRAIGVVLVAFAIAGVAVRLQSASAEAWSPAGVVRLALFAMAGVGLIVGRAAARWLAIVALGVFSVGMAGYVATHFDAWLFVAIVARIVTIVVLLQPGARMALAREANHADAAPPAWVRLAMWVCIPVQLGGVAEALIKVVMGVPVVQ